MQQATNQQLPRPTKNATSFEKTILGRRKQGTTQRSFHSLSSYEQTEREKFAQQYSKLTKQFRAILARSSQKGNIFRQNNASNLVKRFKIDPNHRQRRAITEGVEQTQNYLKEEDSLNQKDDTAALKNKSRLARLQDLYNNRLHNEIVETASKLQRNKKQSTASIVNMSPQQKTQPFIISPIKKVAQPNKIERSADKQIFIHLQKEKNQKINLKFSKIPETLAHFHNIFKIYELLGDYKNNYSNLIKNIKKYVMNHNGADISKLQELLKIPRDRERLKVFLCLEKVSILGILDAMIKQNQLGVKNESKVILQTIFGVYKSIINYILEQNNQREKPQLQPLFLESLQLCQQMLQSLGVQNRKDLQSTSEYLFKKIQSLFRSNLELFHKIKQLLTSLANVDIKNSEMNIKISPNPKNSPTFNININRFFYFLLSQYAHWLNSTGSVQVLKVHKNMLDFFATSPAPHLTFAPPPGKITVVIQLQGVLALVKSNNQQHQKLTFRMRPHALEFLEEMYQKVQIILMTTLMPQNLPNTEINAKNNKIIKNKQDPVQKMLSLSSFILYKYHYVRYHGLLVKDMNRMGRKPQNLILVDGISYPSIPPIDMIRNQKANTEYLISQRNSSLNEQSLIPISIWKGSPQDSQLRYLKQILLNIIEEQPQDVREVIKKLKKVEKKHQIQERYDSQLLQPIQSLEQEMNNVEDIGIQKQCAHEAKHEQILNNLDADDGKLDKLK